MAGRALSELLDFVRSVPELGSLSLSPEGCCCVIILNPSALALAFASHLGRPQMEYLSLERRLHRAGLLQKDCDVAVTPLQSVAKPFLSSLPPSAKTYRCSRPSPDLLALFAPRVPQQLPVMEDAALPSRKRAADREQHPDDLQRLVASLERGELRPAPALAAWSTFAPPVLTEALPPRPVAAAVPVRAPDLLDPLPWLRFSVEERPIERRGALEVELQGEEFLADPVWRLRNDAEVVLLPMLDATIGTAEGVARFEALLGE